MGGNRTPILDERLYYGDGFDWISMYHTHLIKGGALILNMRLPQAFGVSPFESHQDYMGFQMTSFFVALRVQFIDR